MFLFGLGARRSDHRAIRAIFRDDALVARRVSMPRRLQPPLLLSRPRESKIIDLLPPSISGVSSGRESLRSASSNTIRLWYRRTTHLRTRRDHHPPRTCAKVHQTRGSARPSDAPHRKSVPAVRGPTSLAFLSGCADYVAIVSCYGLSRPRSGTLRCTGRTS